MDNAPERIRSGYFARPATKPHYSQKRAIRYPVDAFPGVAYDASKPVWAADRAPAYGRLSLPRRGPGGYCRRRRRRFRRLIGNCRTSGKMARPGNVGVAGNGFRSTDDWRIPWPTTQRPRGGPSSSSMSGSPSTGPACSPGTGRSPSTAPSRTPSMSSTGCSRLVTTAALTGTELYARHKKSRR